MPLTFDEIRLATKDIREGFNKREIDGTKSFVEYMKNIGYDYSMYHLILDDIITFANDGFLAIKTENPNVGGLFVKTLQSKNFFRKKYSYLMYFAINSDMNNLMVKYNRYEKYFHAFEDFSGLRDGMKI